MKKSNKKFLAIIALVLCLAMVFSACNSGSSAGDKSGTEAGSTPSAGKSPGAETGSKPGTESGPGTEAAAPIATKKTPDDTLVYAITFSYSKFDAPNTVSDFITPVLMVYETLVRYLPGTGELVPCLAESWKVVDGKTLVFQLREGVKFHDGNTLTAADVLYTWQRVLKSTIFGGYAKQIDFDNCTVDGNTLTVKLFNDNTEFIYILATRGFSVLSKAYAESVGDDVLNLKPCGTGPFELSSFTEGESIVFTRFADYWGEPSQYGTVIIKPIMEEATRSISFESGDIDIARITTSDSIKSLTGRESEGIKVAETTGSTIYYLNFLDQGIFENTDLRRAFAYAIDWAALAEAIWGDYATPCASALTTASPYKIDVGHYEHDVDKAKQCLAAGGYPDGFSIDIAVSNSGNDQDIAAIMQSYLAEVGIQLNITVADNAVTRQMSSSGEMEIGIAQNTGFTPALSSIWSAQLTGSNSLLQEVHTHYPAGVKFQELFAKIIKATDEATRAKLTEEIQKLAYDECLWIPIVQTDNVWVYWDYVDNVDEMIAESGLDAGLDIRAIT